MAKMSGDVKTRRVISHRIYCHNLLLSSPFEKRCSQPVSSRCKCLLGRVHSFYSHLPSSSCPLDVLRLSLLSTLPDCPTQLHPFSHLPHLGLFSFLYYAFSHVLLVVLPATWKSIWARFNSKCISRREEACWRSYEWGYTGVLYLFV